MMHRLRPNTIEGSRKNIHDHYDLGNDFFRLFLDEETMLYSAAFHRDVNEPLAEAQRNKLHKLIERAEIKPGDHVLEIGCGWGGFAIEAVRKTGCRVTAITISQAQYDLATQRVKAAGLEGRIEVKICDYRKIEGQFDRVVSIEMIEAVGHEFLPDYFSAIDRALKPGGKAVLQAITIPHERYENYRRDVDWIRKHIFPGGHLPSVEVLHEAAGSKAALRIESLEDIGPHYALTLREWRRRFLAQLDRVKAMGFDDEFIRKWDFYFALCESSFASRVLGNHHVVLSR
jgi:cyclopropane-fatty-acyl-phospholipid synthase